MVSQLLGGMREDRARLDKVNRMCGHLLSVVLHSGLGCEDRVRLDEVFECAGTVVFGDCFSIHSPLAALPACPLGLSLLCELVCPRHSTLPAVQSRVPSRRGYSLPSWLGGRRYAVCP